MTKTEQVILDAVYIGARKAHINYLPEVLSLMNKDLISMTGQQGDILLIEPTVRDIKIEQKDCRKRIADFLEAR